LSWALACLPSPLKTILQPLFPHFFPLKNDFFAPAHDASFAGMEPPFTQAVLFQLQASMQWPLHLRLAPDIELFCTAITWFSPRIFGLRSPSECLATITPIIIMRALPYRVPFFLSTDKGLVRSFVGPNQSPSVVLGVRSFFEVIQPKPMSSTIFPFPTFHLC